MRSRPGGLLIGAPGAGGSFGFADPQCGVVYAYVMNRMSTRMGGDPRDVALRDAFYRAIGQPDTMVERLVSK